MAVTRETVEAIEEYSKKRMNELIRKGEKPTLIGGPVDYLGDSEITNCAICGRPVFIRPWTLEIVNKYHLKVVCVLCVDPKDFKGQLAVDFAKIETLLEQVLALKIKKNWTKFTAFAGPVTGTPYSAWRSPDGKIEVGIHDHDNEIFCIHIVETDQWLLNKRDVLRFLTILQRGVVT